MNLTILNSDISEAVWVPVAAALFGGILSLAGAFGATMLANRSAKKVRKDEAERTAAEQAYTTYFKLMEGYNAVANLKRQIDEMFASADESGASNMEPWGKVTPIIGADYAVEAIYPSETAFLIHEKKADLLNEVHLIQHRVSNILVFVKKYNELRSELNYFFIANMSEGEMGEGTAISGKFEGIQKIEADFRTSQLNNLIGQILESLDKDVPRSWKALSDFKYAASERFGSLFPKFEHIQEF